MSALITHPNVARPDDLYEALIRLHDGLDDAQSLAANSRLILLLINHIGDEQVLREAFDLARGEQPAD